MTTSTTTTSTTTTSTAAKDFSPPTGPVDRLRGIGVTGIVVAIALSALGLFLVMSEGNNGSPGAAIGILFLTVPVALARRYPLAAMSIVTVAAIVNGLLFDDVVRCGAAFPALLYITFAVGSRSRLGGRGWGWPLLGLAMAFVSVAAQRVWDPVLDNGFVALAIPLVLLAWGAGLGWSIIGPRTRRGDRAVHPAQR